MKIKSRINMKVRQQEGLSLVEMAIVALLFFTLIFAILDFGLLLYNQQVITNAAREAARFGVVARPLLKDIEGTIILNEKITKSDIENLAIDYAKDSVIIFGDKDNDFEVNAEFPNGQTYCENFQDKLKVTIKCDYSFIFLPFDLDPMQSTSVMLCE